MAIVTPFVQVGTYPTRNFATLGTVIVTAAVYRDFDQELAPHQLIFQHRAGVTPYTSTFVFAECCVLVNSRSHLFFATHSRFVVHYTLLGHTFFRSYGVNLPSSFSRVLSSA